MTDNVQDVRVVNDPAEDAYADCLKNCFGVLVANLAVDEANAAAMYRKCCQTCRQAKQIACLVPS